MKKKIVAGLLAGLMFLTACGSNSYDAGLTYNKSAASAVASYSDEYVSYAPGYYGDYEESGYSPSEMKVEANTGTGGTGSSKEDPQADRESDSARKRIITYNLSVETEDFDGLLNSLEARVESFGGYFESVDTYNGSKYGNDYRSSRRSSIKIRVPARKADEFVQFIGDNSNITNKTLSSEDVTLAYVDTQSKRDTYKIEQQRLLDLLDKAETVEDILTIEERLSEVRYKLESMESQLRTYDNLIDYTAIYLNVDEVKQYTPPKPDSYVQRLGRAFVEGWEGFVEWLQDVSIGFAETLPAWIFLAIVVVVVILIIKKVRKNKRTGRKAKKAQQTANAQAQPQAANEQAPAQNTDSQEKNGQQ
ncbi:MAG: DUF4349 domain-containing protein [Lachnospiraceae bacterium]|nr:DUF4349 domain-containing protein [Lachnospiraceae bacterium]